MARARRRWLMIHPHPRHRFGVDKRTPAELTRCRLLNPTVLTWSFRAQPLPSARCLPSRERLRPCRPGRQAPAAHGGERPGPLKYQPESDREYQREEDAVGGEAEGRYPVAE